MDSKGTVVEGLDRYDAYNEELDRKLWRLKFFQRLKEIPCFRESFLYGIMTGIGGGAVYFAATSKALMSSHVGMGSFCTFTLGYYFYCRIKISSDNIKKKKFQKMVEEYSEVQGTDKDPFKEKFKEEFEKYWSEQRARDYKDYRDLIDKKNKAASSWNPFS